MLSVLTLTYLMLVAFVGTQASTCPRLLTRAQWGANNPRHTSAYAKKPFVVVVKETGKSCQSRARCAQAVKAVQNKDMNVDKLDDIMCNFVIGSDGNVYEGSGWNNYVLGDYTVAICVLGDQFNSKAVPQKQKDTIENFLSCSNTQSKLRDSYVVQTIRDALPTSSNPGTNLYNFVKTLPNYKGNSTA